MSKQNLQIQNSYLSSIPKNPQQQANQQIIEEINHLKHIVLEMERKHLAKGEKVNLQKEVQQQKQIVPSQELQTKKIVQIGESKLAFGQDFYKQMNQKFKTRMVSRKPIALLDVKQDKPNSPEQKPIEDRSIIYDCQAVIKKDSFKATEAKVDAEQQQPAKTQFFIPTVKKHQNQVLEYHFKKLDLLPALEEDSNKFKSYLKTQREKVEASRYQFQKGSPSTVASRSFSNNYKFSSQPQLPSTNKQILKTSISQIVLNKDNTKQQLITAGKRLFQYFMPNFNSQSSFTIKRYKNCIVFSMLPEMTKAVMYYYESQIYFGNVSLNQKGKIQKNGPGVQHMHGRHVYEGHFINSKKNGSGKITYINGDTYNGQWRDGQIFGFGIFVDKKNGKSFEGFWRNGQYCGQLIKISEMKIATS